MRILGNIVWLIFGGLEVALFYYIVGSILCATVIGVPFGLQLFKLGTLALWPFGHELVSGTKQSGCLSFGMNLIWILLGWWEIAIIHLVFGLILCITIVGFPWGTRHFKMAIASFSPFGKIVKASR